jgi:hypothetical protein
VTERIALVGCVKTKRKGTYPARDLYVSPLFRKRRAFVEAAGPRWWILSAAYGLVAPETRLRDYERTLNAMGAAERREWGRRVLEALRTDLGDVGQHSFEIHAGSHYVNAIAPGLRAAGATVDVPTAGLALGRQLAWYGQRIRP